MRMISIAARPIPNEPCGGGRGVSYRLMKANEKYQLFNDTIFLFSDMLISSSYGHMRIESDVSIKHPEQLEQLYAQLDKILIYQETDRFIFHDLESFYAMRRVFANLRNSLVVYHQQGSLYSEYLFFGNEPDAEYEKLCFDLTKFAIEEASFFAFPSLGAKQALLDTLPGICHYLENKPEIILYNGCSPSILPGRSAIDDLIEVIKQVKGEVFITVAALNEAKGVERLPQFFRDYGRYVDDYFWIVIGNGPKRGELADGLAELEGHVLWLDGWVDNCDVIKLYNAADYYILAHRFSIFDYSTIEAMHMGCIPVLTRVGGNLEMIIEENGYFLSDSLSAKEFVVWRNNKNICEMKEKNRQIASKKFSEYCMLRSYYDVVMEG